jgi:hypothetical protein
MWWLMMWHFMFFKWDFMWFCHLLLKVGGQYLHVSSRLTARQRALWSSRLKFLLWEQEMGDLNGFDTPIIIQRRSARRMRDVRANQDWMFCFVVFPHAKWDHPECLSKSREFIDIYPAGIIRDILFCKAPRRSESMWKNHITSMMCIVMYRFEHLLHVLFMCDCCLCHSCSFHYVCLEYVL